MNEKTRFYKYVEDDIVTDESGHELSPLDDDYGYYKSELDNLTNPLSDDYCKYDNE